MTNKTERTSIKSILTSVALAALISLNGIRCMLNISDSSMIINIAYIIFVVLSISNILKRKSFKVQWDMAIILFSILIVSVYALSTAIFNGQFVSAFKLVVMFLLGICIVNLTDNEVEDGINYSMILCTIYVLYVIFNITTVRRYVANGSNYLNVTLPIGLALSMFLVSGIHALISKKSKFYVAISFTIAGLSLYALTMFAARGSILIPIIPVLVVSLLLGRKNIKKFLVVAIILVAVLYVGYNLYSKYAGSYLSARMSRLFNSAESEDRWTIWKNYIEYISSNHFWLVGGGANSSIVNLGSYPHNLFLQLIGEFGLIGITLCVSTTTQIIKSLVYNYAYMHREKEEEAIGGHTYYCLLSGLIYVFFTFMKSFSLYDGTLFVIFASLVLQKLSSLRVKQASVSTIEIDERSMV